MADKKLHRQENHHISQDADFGVFTPEIEHVTHVPAYATWTPFSGIPPDATDPHSFGWDKFVTPPSTPLVGIKPTFHSPDFFSNFNLMDVIGKNSLIDIDSNSQDNDKLASTPVAQSLLEVLNSNSLLNPLINTNMPLQAPLSFDNSCQNGFDIMYAEALQKLGTPWESYNPFGTSDIMNQFGTSEIMNSQSWTQSHIAVQPTLDVNLGSSPANIGCKPSYSEVAKTLKSQQSLPKDKEESVELRKRSLDNVKSRSFKGSKKFIPRPLRVRTNSMPNDMRPSVSPDSKYGLDDFSDMIIGYCSEDKDSGIDSIPSLTRKNSTTSLSSATSGIEEIHLTKTCNSCLASSSEQPNTLEKISNKEKVCNESFSNASKGSSKSFYNGRRILKAKDTNKHQSQSKIEDIGPTILNNGKPSYAAWCPTTTHKAWCPTTAHEKSTNYINNNLRDALKRTNQNPVIGTKGQNVPPENVYPEPAHGQADKPLKSKPSLVKDKLLTVKPDISLQTSFDHELIDEWLTFLWEKAKICMHQLWTRVLMVILLVSSIIVYLASGGVHSCGWLWGQLRTEAKVFICSIFGKHLWDKITSTDTPKKIGLDENIILPATGEEAMQRLLACKSKDPYSILGLQCSASDEDIQKYYRQQAILVHPDKNQQPGAEEVFKILGHAFDLIGDASKRLTYDHQLQEVKEAEDTVQEFSNLLTKLQEKIQKTGNLMHCDICGKKHKCVLMERPWYSARFCDRCGIRHPSKESDVWAETSMLGFLWHYYACMDGKVFDITDWVACKADFFRHMQANAHHVFYAIATEGSKGHHERSNGAHATGHAGAGGEPDLQGLSSNLFNNAVNTDGMPGSHSLQPPCNTIQTLKKTASATSHTSTQGKRQRRKKKKH